MKQNHSTKRREPKSLADIHIPPYRDELHGWIETVTVPRIETDRHCPLLRQFGRAMANG